MNITSHLILYLSKIMIFSMFTSLLLTNDETILFTAVIVFVVVVSVVVVTVGLEELVVDVLI